MWDRPPRLHVEAASEREMRLRESFPCRKLAEFHPPLPQLQNHRLIRVDIRSVRGMF
jgi:hypothetical protein